jgi:type II secretory pathway pseudopilin PulG
MTSQIIGLFIGGVLPAVFFGLSGIFAKASNLSGIGLGYYLLAIGIAVIIVGLICLILVPGRAISVVGMRDAFFSGATWAVGAALVAVALVHFNSSISQLVPLYNMNTLVGVVLGLWLFSEWQTLNLFKLITGALLIIIGGGFVALA